ncbi:MAG: hypothetical protein ACLRMZ_11540 [Blautia marasmi]
MVKRFPQWNMLQTAFVSLDTIRRAYLRLQKDGYITISQNVGSVVIKDYSEQQIEDNVQLFFSQRKNALIDLSKSIGPADRPCPVART